MPVPGPDEFTLLLPWVWVGALHVALGSVPGGRWWRVVAGLIGTAGLGAALYLLYERDLGPLPLDWPPRPNALSTHWVLYAALGATLQGLIESALDAWPDSVLRHARWLLRAAVVGWFLYGVTTSLRASTWQPGEARVWLAGLGAGMLLLLAVTELARERLRGPLLPLTLGAISGLSALIFQGWSSVGQAELCGLLAGSLTLGALPAFFLREAALPRGIVSLHVLTQGALWVEGLFYLPVDPPPHLFLLLAAVPCALLATTLPPFAGRRPGPLLAARVLLVLALLGATWQQAAAALPQERAGPAADDPYADFFKPR